MSRLLTWLFLLSISLTFLTSNVRADDVDTPVEDSETYDDEEFDDDEDAVSSSDITVKTLFPNHGDKKFGLGEDVTLLVAFNNNGDKTFNVSSIAGHLHSPFDYNYYIQNFTVKNAPAVVGPNSQVSLEYTFKPDKALEPLEFWLSAYVNYNRSDGRGFMHTLHNATVELVEPTAGSSQKLIMYVIVLAGLGVLGYVFLQANKVKSQSSEASTASRGRDWDDDIYKPAERAKRAGGKRNKGKKA
jgi:hypothetical protein